MIARASHQTAETTTRRTGSGPPDGIRSPKSLKAAAGTTTDSSQLSNRPANDVPLASSANWVNSDGWIGGAERGERRTRAPITPMPATRSLSLGTRSHGGPNVHDREGEHDACRPAPAGIAGPQNHAAKVRAIAATARPTVIVRRGLPVPTPNPAARTMKVS